ncbi:MAG: DUF3833 domain-containing protein [Thalassobaculaceae bacterium]
MKPTDFKNATPQLVIEEYFAGDTQAWGLFEDRFGTIRRQFSVDITGTWDGEFLTLDEKFIFEDGERDRRIWKIRKTGDKTYTGTAGDVIGEATGRASGNALNWRYQMDLKVGTSTLRVRFDDWMFLQSSGVLLNRARVTKFGIEIGTVTLAFMKNAAAAADQAHSNDWQSAAEPKRAANQ